MIPTITTVFVKGDAESFETFKRLFEAEVENTLGKDFPYVAKKGKEIVGKGFCNAASIKYAENIIEIFKHNLNSVLADLGIIKPTPKFNIGDWVIVLDNVSPKWFNHKKAVGHVFQIEEGVSIESFKYGINYHVSNLRHATDQEIRDHLWKEAQEKGIKIGTTVKDVSGIPAIGKILLTPTLVKNENDCILISTGQAIYHNGKWATVVDEEKTTNFFEHEVNWDSSDEVIEVGCQGFTKEQFYNMYRFMDNLTDNFDPALTIGAVFDEMDKVKYWLESL